MLIWGNWGGTGVAPNWRVEQGCGLCVCMYVTVCSCVMPGVYSCWWDGEVVL